MLTTPHQETTASYYVPHPKAALSKYFYTPSWELYATRSAVLGASRTGSGLSVRRYRLHLAYVKT